MIVGDIATLGWVALKAALLYLTAVFGLRLARRRVLAEMTAIDFVAAVAVGAVVGRVPNATGTSFLAGAVTLLVVLAAHSVLSRLRRWPAVSRAVDHRPRILVAEGRILTAELHGCGLTRDDLLSLLRERHVTSLPDVRYAIFEPRGSLSLVLAGDRHDDALVADIEGRAAQSRGAVRT